MSLTHIQSTCAALCITCVLSIYAPLCSSLDPVIVQPAAPGVRMTSLLFSSQADCVVVGDSDGHVTVYQLKNLNVGEQSQVTLSW